jgi:hypothetical protein
MPLALKSAIFCLRCSLISSDVDGILFYLHNSI